jgi:hypothetical protein
MGFLALYDISYVSVNKLNICNVVDILNLYGFLIIKVSLSLNL